MIGELAELSPDTIRDILKMSCEQADCGHEVVVSIEKFTVPDRTWESGHEVVLQHGDDGGRWPRSETALAELQRWLQEAHC